MPSKTAGRVWAETERLRDACDALTFVEPTAYVYNPLVYAGEMHKKYVERFATGQRRTLFLGMNPGPFGMAQTGVPFGEIATVRDWLRLRAPIGAPEKTHPKRPILGLECPRSEVSGRRLWGLFGQICGDAATFFRHNYVANYCPLVFLEEGGRNRTPDKLPREERTALDAICDAHLAALVDILRPKALIGVGKYAEAAFQRVIGGDRGIQIGTILHPSPASPLANRGFEAHALRQLEEQNIALC